MLWLFVIYQYLSRGSNAQKKLRVNVQDKPSELNASVNVSFDNAVVCMCHKSH